MFSEDQLYRPVLTMVFHKLDGLWHSMDLRNDLLHASASPPAWAGDQDPVDFVENMSKDISQFVAMPHTSHGPWRDRPADTFRVIRNCIKP